MHRIDAARLLKMRLAAAGKRYAAKLGEIDEALGKQRADCAREYDETRSALDAAVREEQAAIVAARADKARAEERRKAAQAHLIAARAERRAKTKHKRESCKIEAGAIRARKGAERDHHREAVAIERSILKQNERAPRVTLRASEEREQVEFEIPDNLRPLWKRVGRTFRVPARKEGRASLYEAFIEYAEEDPEAVAAAQEAELQAEMTRLEREARAQRRKAGGGRGRRGSGERRWGRMGSAEARDIDRELEADGIPF